MTDGRLRESEFAKQMDYLEFGVENEAGTFVFVTEEDLQWGLNNRDVSPVDDQLPGDMQALKTRVDADELLTEVTLTRTESGLIRTKEIEVTNVFDLGHLYHATQFLRDDVDVVAEANFYMMAKEHAPLTVEFPRSPPELVGMIRERTPLGPDEVTDSDCREPSGCLIPASDVRN